MSTYNKGSLSMGGITTAEIVRRLDAKPAGENAWKAKCPAHPDKTPSLSIAVGEKGGTVFHCHANCKPEDICAKIGLKIGDLCPPIVPPDFSPIRKAKPHGSQIF